MSKDMPDLIICAKNEVKNKGFGTYGGSNFGFSHWNGWSSLQQCCLWLGGQKSETKFSRVCHVN